MTRLVLAFLIVSSSICYGQYDYKISGNNISASKKPSLNSIFMIQPLPWTAIESECIEKNEFELGAWVTYKPKAAAATITLQIGGQWGNVKHPIMYFGTVNSVKGDDKLEEISCVELKDGETILQLSFNDLEVKKEYYILVVDKDARKKDFFNLHISENYMQLAPPPAEKKEEKKETLYAMGRISNLKNEPQGGVTVALLDPKMQIIRSATSDSKGQFKFEALPKDEVVLTRIEADDSELMIDLFLYDNDGTVIKRAVKIGSRLYSFEAIKNSFTQLRLLSESDWKLNVTKGMAGIAGRLVDSETFLYSISDVEIGLYDASFAKLKSTKTDRDGRFEFMNVEKGEYSVRVEGNSDGTYSEVVMVDDLNVPYEYSNSDETDGKGFQGFSALPADIVEMRRMEVKDIQLNAPTDFKTMKAGKAIVLENILFESGSVQLVPSSFAELDRLVSALKEQTTIKIEISGHTDNEGSEASNQMLSLGRAESVRKYLESKGIKKDRLSHKGFGETNPIASNDTEAGRKQNRRVEIVVVE